MPLIHRSYYDAEQKGVNDAQAQQQNALALQQQQRVNALLGNQTATPEDYARAGRSDISNSLVNLQNEPVRQQAAQDEKQKAFATRYYQAAQYGIGSSDPKGFIEQNYPELIQHYKGDWNAAKPEEIKASLKDALGVFGPMAGIDAPKETFGAAQNLTIGGRPSVAQVSNTGTVRPIQGATPYVAPDRSNGIPSGYQKNTDGTMSYIPGGPADPNKPTPTNLGAREGVMLQRVLSSANEAATSIKNIVELPIGASSGYFGVGASPGHSILSSVKGVLTNKASAQETQDYNSMLAGVRRNLATIETAGLAASGALTESFGALELREGDTEFTKLRKLAEMRQIVEKGLETNLDNPRIPSEQKDALRRIVTSVRSAVPFTHGDLTKLQRAQQSNPDATLQDLIQQQGLNKDPSASNASGWKVEVLPQ